MTPELQALKAAEDALATLRGLLTTPAPAPPPPPSPAGESRLLTLQDFKDGAARLKVPLKTVQAVDEVESGRDGGFDSLDRCTVLFEPHVFSRETGHRFDDTKRYIDNVPWLTAEDRRMIYYENVLKVYPRLGAALARMDA